VRGPAYDLGFRVKRIIGIACIAVAAQGAGADVLNGGFEAGLAGWDALGVANATSIVGVVPPEGSSQAVLRSSGIGDLDAIDAALGAPFGTLATFGFRNPVRASVIYQTVSVAAGDTLSFRWNFLSNEGPFGLNDFAFFSIGGSLRLLGDVLTPSVPLPAASDFSTQTGYALLQVPFASAATFVLGFGVADEGAAGIESALLVDDVRILPFGVPEPATLALVVLAILAAMARVRGGHALQDG
jgi:hypothetical protein